MTHSKGEVLLTGGSKAPLRSIHQVSHEFLDLFAGEIFPIEDGQAFAYFSFAVKEKYEENSLK